MISTTFLNVIFSCGFDLKMKSKKKLSPKMVQTRAERNLKWRCFLDLGRNRFAVHDGKIGVTACNIQCRKTYCAGFCASPLALLAGSGYNASCKVCNDWKIRYARMSFGWFIYTWATMKFFRHFTVKKTSLLLPAETLSYLCIQWVAYKYAICRVFVDKISLRTEISCVSWESKGFGNRF